MKLARE